MVSKKYYLGFRKRKLIFYFKDNTVLFTESLNSEQVVLKLIAMMSLLTFHLTQTLTGFCFFFIAFPCAV